MRRFAPLILAGLLLGIAPITGPELPARFIDYVKPEPPAEVTMIAVGDIMLSRAVATRMRWYGPEYPFASTSDFIREADIAFGNLETTITEGEEVPPFTMSFRADSASAAALRDAGFDVLSLANNHMSDFGETGVIDTLRYLDSVDIAHAGAGRDAVEAGRPAFIEANGIRFAFLAYTYTASEAGEGRAGTAFMRTERMREAVQAAKQRADFVIVSMHAGDEYVPLPNDQQKTFARAAIDAGAELVIGHHPHVVQTMEQYRGKYIFYSLGNFIFDQMWSQETRDGLALKLVFTKEGVDRVSYHATEIHDYAQPRLLEEGSHAAGIIGRLNAVQ